VEAQVLGDQHGTVVVVGDRDCSLQRRHQKLVEEAPAPFLTPAQRVEIHAAAKAICEKAGYVSAGTVEFLVGQDGTVSFLEVNTRLQVEHPVTEEVTGIDLVREQFRIADGERLTYGTPTPRGHAIEFRINGEDPGRGFLPSPGTVTRWEPPDGPGVRLDAGVRAGSEIGGNFDSMLAKLVVTGATRRQALERASRALDEFVVEGIPTVLPFHRAVVADPAYSGEPFEVHTRWIETEWDSSAMTPQPVGATGDAEPRQPVTVEVGGRRLEVVLPAGLALGTAGGASSGRAAPKRAGRAKAGAQVSGDALTSPMQGTLVKIAVEEGATVEEGALVVVLEAMKMEQPLTAHRSGIVKGLTVSVGEVVTSGAVICEIVDPA
jgi:acetyl-CoA/propionyl-CoA carboxylase biotin carboxyl carrier protein